MANHISQGKPRHFSRGFGVVAAREYILSRKPSRALARELEDLREERAWFPCLHGINLPIPQVRKAKNVLGNPLPHICC